MIMMGMTVALPRLEPAPTDAAHPPIFGMPRALFAVLALSVYDAGAAGTGVLYAAVSAGVAVVSGGLACVAGVLVIAALFPALYAYDGRVQGSSLA